MPGVEKRTISLPAEQARYVDSLVESGRDESLAVHDAAPAAARRKVAP